MRPAVRLLVGRVTTTRPAVRRALSTRRAASSLTHVDAATRLPKMVDVGAKTATRRRAVAACRVRFPAAAWAVLTENGFEAKKGPVLATAVVAGVQGAKKTSDLVPFCHAVPLDACDVTFEIVDADRALDVTCAVATTHKTGVEMEALAGCSLAALAVYDMTKALSHDIVVEGLQLLEKTGGKSDVVRTR
mmetsp:Transcript_9141/g.28586  ORF Transcript_9141/g.28586 Transcript_9141/m.28586 type:complete len:190 (-) Transcript_9141:8-577(-)